MVPCAKRSNYILFKLNMLHAFKVEIKVLISDCLFFCIEYANVLVFNKKMPLYKKKKCLFVHHGTNYK